MATPVYLIGDGAFANERYVDDPSQSVAGHLRAMLDAASWRVILRAEEYAGAQDIATHHPHRDLSRPCRMVVSVGGHDAFAHIALIADPAKLALTTKAFLEFHRIKEAFRAGYVRAIDHLASLEQPLAVCTIFNPDAPDAAMRRMVSAGLSFFNDVICEEALRRGLPIIDLRPLVSGHGDYANPIRPSAQGGFAIARAIARHLDGPSPRP